MKATRSSSTPDTCFLTPRNESCYVARLAEPLVQVGVPSSSRRNLHKPRTELSVPSVTRSCQVAVFDYSVNELQVREEPCSRRRSLEHAELAVASTITRHRP